jgi:peptidyl-prolyl cis-trans isomerase D
MQVVRADGVAPNQPLPEIGTSTDFDQALMGLKQNDVSSPVALPGNKIALAEVTAVIPSRPATFEEVQNDVRNYMVQTRTANALQKHVQELVTAAKKAGNLASAAKAMGLEIKTSEPFQRQGTAEGIGPASYLQDAFNRPKGSVVGPYPVPEGTVVAQVLEHIAPDMANLAQERVSIRDDIKRRKASDRTTLFREGVRSQLKKQGKIKVNDAVIRRLITNYGSSS